MFDKNSVEKEWFANKNSYNAFLYAMGIAEKLESLRLKGAMIFENNRILPNDGKWVVRLEPEQPVVGFVQGACMVGYAGMCWDDNEKTWVTKKEVKEAFSKIRYTMPESIHKIM
jgi:hypothetical protein